jgi:hypothetical protein
LLALLAERRKSSVTPITLAVYNARNLGESASSRMLLVVVKAHPTLHQQNRKKQFLARGLQELMWKYSRWRSERTVAQPLLDGLRMQLQSLIFIKQSGKELAMQVTHQ